MRAIFVSFTKTVSQPFIKAFKMIENLEKAILGGDKFLSEIRNLK